MTPLPLLRSLPLMAMMAVSGTLLAAEPAPAKPDQGKELRQRIPTMLADRWRSPTALGMDPASALLRMAPPALQVDRWLAGAAVESFAPDKTYAVCFGNLVDLDLGLLADKLSGNGKPVPPVTWIVVVDPQTQKGEDATTRQRRLAITQQMIEEAGDQLKDRPISIALDTVDNHTRIAWQIPAPGPAMAAFIHRGRVVWGGPMKSPWLDYLAENIEEIGDSLSFVERQVQEVQRRARPLLDLTADIWERGYPLPGELDRLLLLASLVERADLQTRFVDWCDGLRGGVGAFSGQRLLWHTFNELVRDVFSSDPFRPLTADQRERFLSEFRRMATPEEFEREVGRAKGYDAMRRVIAAHRAGNPGQMAAAAADLELAHDARGLLTAAWIIADSTKNTELVRRLVTTARSKVTVADVDALLIENAYTALKAIGAADEVRGWATEALSNASDPGQQARIKRVLDSIR